jgi:hypothetical protein
MNTPRALTGPTDLPLKNALSGRPKSPEPTLPDALLEETFFSDDFNRINELLAVWFDQAQSIREVEIDKPRPAGKPRRIFSFYGSTFALKQRAQARPLRSSQNAATSDSVQQSLDTDLQISLFGKLKLTNCARPGNRAGFFMPASCGRSQNSQQVGAHVHRIGLSRGES